MAMPRKNKNLSKRAWASLQSLKNKEKMKKDSATG